MPPTRGPRLLGAPFGGSVVKHIVLWSLKPEAPGRSKRENALLIKERLEALVGIVPGLLRAEVGIDFGGTEQSFDIALVAEFESRAALAGYRDHPAHQDVVTFIREVREDRVAVDYEV